MGLTADGGADPSAKMDSLPTLGAANDGDGDRKEPMAKAFKDKKLKDKKLKGKITKKPKRKLTREFSTRRNKRRFLRGLAFFQRGRKLFPPPTSNIYFFFPWGI